MEHFPLSYVLCVWLACTSIASLVRADAWNKRIVVTFRQPVEIVRCVSWFLPPSFPPSEPERFGLPSLGPSIDDVTVFGRSLQCGRKTGLQRIPDHMAGDQSTFALRSWFCRWDSRLA